MLVKSKIMVWFCFLSLVMMSTMSHAKNSEVYSKQLKNMMFIAGGEFGMGSENPYAQKNENPVHIVSVDSFWMDMTPVTNAQFAIFVDDTGYITTAEQKPDIEELKKQLPKDSPLPDESLLVPASLVFVQPDHPVSQDNSAAWWVWVVGANWREPNGPGSNVNGLDHHPVVHVSYDDAMAYASWSGKSLPTEAEWEYAARAGLTDKLFSWGNDEPDEKKPCCNIWHGVFPHDSSKKIGTTSVKTFKPNIYGLYDMAGNVWEWCEDWYSATYYSTLAGLTTENPRGPGRSFDPFDKDCQKRVLRGGSFLCHKDYCMGYRVSARTKTSPDTSLSHVGFRCVVRVKN